MPIYTLPILDKKIYVVTTPTLLQRVFRSKDLSFEPFMLEFSQRLLGVSDRVREPTRRESENAKEPSFMQQVVKEIYTSLSGECLAEMNLSTLTGFASVLNRIDNTFLIESFYVWLRSTLTLATTNSLFGTYNPMKSHQDLIGLYWYVALISFCVSAVKKTEGLRNPSDPLSFDFAPSLLAPKAHKGWIAIKATLRDYYIAQKDLEPDVARIAKQQAALLREHGMSDQDIKILSINFLLFCFLCG